MTTAVAGLYKKDTRFSSKEARMSTNNTMPTRLKRDQISPASIMRMSVEMSAP
jgi:hypothetical protein